MKDLVKAEPFSGKRIGKRYLNDTDIRDLMRALNRALEWERGGSLNIGR